MYHTPEGLSWLGILYLGSGGNLWVPIVAHGVTDTLDSLIIFTGHYPGMH